MSNSSLVDYVKISPNKTVPRNHTIDTITIHCVVGQCSVETIGAIFAPVSRQASSNYGIGPDGRIGMYVEEKDRSWCSSSSANDNRSVTIECASDKTPPYTINNTVYNTLIELCADICRRNNIKKLIWKADKSLIGQAGKQNLTVHRWFSNTACPGDYIYGKLGQVAKDVNDKLVDNSHEVLYHIQVGAFHDKSNADEMLSRIKSAGFDAYIIKADNSNVPTSSKKNIDDIANEVIRGLWGNGLERKNRINDAGYDYEAIQKRVEELL